MGLREKTAANIKWTGIAQVFSVGLYQVVLLILANILSPFDFGVYAACTVVNTILVQLTTFGLDAAVINSRREWRQVISVGTLLRLVMAGVGYCAVIVLAGILAQLFQIENLEIPLLIAASAALVLSIGFPAQIYLSKNLMFKPLSLSKIAGASTWAGLAMALAILGWDYWALVLALLASQIVTVITAYIFSRQVPRVAYEKETAAKLMRFGGVTAAGSFLALLAANLDKFFVGSLVSPDELGIYWAMFTYGAGAPAWLTGIINSVMFPTYTTLVDTPESLRKAYSETLRFVSEFSAPIAVGLAGGSAIFVTVLLGERWEAGIESLAVLSIAGYFMAMTSPAGTVFISIGRPDLIFKITLVFLLPMIPLLFVLTDSYGIFGAASVILGHEVAKCAYVVYKAGRLTGLAGRSVVRSILPSVAAALSTGAVVYVISVILGLTPISLVLALSLGLGTYFLIGIPMSKGQLLADARESLATIRGAGKVADLEKDR